MILFRWSTDIAIVARRIVCNLTTRSNSSSEEEVSLASARLRSIIFFSSGVRGTSTSLNQFIFRVGPLIPSPMPSVVGMGTVVMLLATSALTRFGSGEGVCFLAKLSFFSDAVLRNLLPRILEMMEEDLDMLLGVGVRLGLVVSGQSSSVTAGCPSDSGGEEGGVGSCFVREKRRELLVREHGMQRVSSILRVGVWGGVVHLRGSTVDIESDLVESENRERALCGSIECDSFSEADTLSKTSSLAVEFTSSSGTWYGLSPTSTVENVMALGVEHSSLSLPVESL